MDCLLCQRELFIICRKIFKVFKLKIFKVIYGVFFFTHQRSVILLLVGILFAVVQMWHLWLIMVNVVILSLPFSKPLLFHGILFVKKKKERIITYLKFQLTGSFVASFCSSLFGASPVTSTLIEDWPTAPCICNTRGREGWATECVDRGKLFVREGRATECVCKGKFCDSVCGIPLCLINEEK